ncbi:histidine kinase [Flavobacterium aquatile]|uniref:Histidine kinase n=2 Tax=Flavobacterium aquatile TaxID=245 RepID=A0A095SV77_9FLAO|nr:2TM domain-containing protein [Flavobacterium aquatile]KGD68502.1 histidine kinase [Flavobacterium aquatile LMG 4008 = ATCC 11947]OXA68569.1 histidine kinase [Flavobacterium aquatile] [Flavobacterium aquatile LMG 4008 = ATCC 11947]GEC79448.1 histidine kinase [Flavobacterium aquatile]
MELIMDSNSDFEKYQKAKKQVEEIKGFYVHFMAYIVIMCVLVFINLKYTPEHLWFVYSMLGWGLGLFFHAVKVFNWFPFMSKNWEEKKLQQYMDEEKSKSNKYQ